MTITLAPTHVRALIGELCQHNSAVEAAALYGSVARGDIEPHSDIDLLLLCHSGQKRAVAERLQPALSHEFRRLSLALYSPQELKFLERSSSLFLLHLQREADVIFDSSGFLRNLLYAFRPKPSYRADFRDSMALLDPLRTRVANSPNDLHRLSYAYSLFRVFGVYLLAERSIFEFSKSRMAACLSREYPHARNAVAALSELRVLNANFFSGAPQSEPGQRLAVASTSPSYVSALGALTETPVTVSECTYIEALGEFTAAAASFRRFNYRLRTWFLLLAYDGMNLYCKKNGIVPMTSFQPECVEKLLSEPLPPSVAAIASQVLDHIRDYRLKYFLNEDAKISAKRAIDNLQALADEI